MSIQLETAEKPNVTPLFNIEMDAYRKLRSLAEIQEKNGFGSADTSVMFTECWKQEALLSLKRLEDKELFLEYIKEPKIKQIGRNQKHMSFFKPPQVAMLKMGSYAEATWRTWFRGSFNTSVPLIPLSIQEWIIRFNKEVGLVSCDCYIIWEANWRPAPQGDPVIVAHFSSIDTWVKIAEWDGDVQLINEILEAK